MGIRAIREGLKAAAAVITELNGYSYGQGPIVVPAFFVADVEEDFGSALAIGMDVATFNCRALVSKADELGGQEMLDLLMEHSGDRSVKEALEADRTLGGVCVEVFVARAVGPRVFTHELTNYLGAQWTVQVTSRGE